MATEFHVVALNGSPSSSSKTHTVARRAVELAGQGEVIDLGSLDSAALLGRAPSKDVTAALEAIAGAPALLLATPVYRATFSGLLKVILDQLPAQALLGKACILTATGGSAHHSLVIDTALRPLIASLDGWSVPTSLYATADDFDPDGNLSDEASLLLAQAVAEARMVAAAPAAT
jgi:FMN reductase